MSAPVIQTPIVVARDLEKNYHVSGGAFSSSLLLRAVNQISFSVDPGQTLAVVGESGCGKSTLARLVTMIEQPSAGSLTIKGTEVSRATPDELRALRSEVQIVFQNPYGSLNPRKRIRDILEEPLIINTTLSTAQRAAAIAEMFDRIGLRREHGMRYPHMFSGGQRQRVAIARALMLRPSVVVADEPVSALDISVRAQILNLLSDIQDEIGVAYLFISHDLGVVERIADRVMVMYLGAVVEEGTAGEIFGNPMHPYTQALIAAAPSTDRARQDAEAVTLKGELPSPLARLPGCPLANRCPRATEICHGIRPALELFDGHRVACHHPGK